jgi:hypothetical protein
MFKNENDFKKATGMDTIEFTRFIRQRTAKKIDADLRRKKLQ